MIIYLDSDFRCHLKNDGTMRAIETNNFDGKCKVFIEGYRFVPSGESWTRSDGKVFYGEMVAPAVNNISLVGAQAQYEEDSIQMQDMKDALEILGVTE